MSNPFFKFGLHPKIVEAVASQNYSVPTAIQTALIPKMLEGRDVIGQAKTGTGKTAAFALPLIHKLDPRQTAVQGLVLAPTRELAKQVAEAIYTYGRPMNVNVLPIYGGQSYDRQIRRLKKGVDIVTATPGRLLDLIRKGIIDLSQVRTVVLDEADEMLSMGFIDDIEAILRATPTTRQTAFFSATLPRSVHRLADRHMDDPHACSIEHDERTAEGIEQRYYLVSRNDRFESLVRLLEVEPFTSALVFARTRVDTFQLADRLNGRGYRAGALNGEMDQPSRQKMLDRFRTRQIDILVGTNVAARGLDIDHISHVFNYELPRDPEVYVHRVGRTARAGKTGIAISLVTANRKNRLRKIERYTKRSITRAEFPTEEDLEAHRDHKLIERMRKWLDQDNNYDREQRITETLVGEGYDPMAIVAAALKTARSNGDHLPEMPEKESVNNSRSRNSNGAPRSHENGMERLALNAGKSTGTRPGQVIQSLASVASIPGGVIGKISIHKKRTLVDVPAQFVDQVLARSGNYRIGKRRVRVERA